LHRVKPFVKDNLRSSFWSFWLIYWLLHFLGVLVEFRRGLRRGVEGAFWAEVLGGEGRALVDVDGVLCFGMGCEKRGLLSAVVP